MIKESEIADGQIWESLELVMSITSRSFDPHPRADVYVKTNRGLQHSDVIWHDRSRIVAWIEDNNMKLINGKIGICKPKAEGFENA